jgi:hypothetical protein
LRTCRDTIWRQPIVVHAYLTGLRAAVPAAAEQIDVMLRLVAATDRPIRRVLDLGSGDGPHRRPPRPLPRRRRDLGRLLRADARRRRRPLRRPDATAAPRRRRPVRTNMARPPRPRAVRRRRLGFAIHHLLDDRNGRSTARSSLCSPPGGIFVNIEHVASPTRWLEHRFDDLMVDVLTAAAPRSAADRSRETIAAEYHARPDKAANLLAPVEAQCSWLRTIGFADVDCWHKCIELAVFGGRKPPTTQDERDG